MTGWVNALVWGRQESSLILGPHLLVPRKARFSSSVSNRSVFARRCSRGGTLDGWMTYAPARSRRARLHGDVMRLMVSPACVASFRNCA